MRNRVVIACGVVGCVLTGIATLASWWANTGHTPAWLFGTLGGLQLLTTHRMIGGVPIEYFSLLWFASITIVETGRERFTSLKSTYICGSAIVAAGLTGSVALQFRDHCWTALSTVILGAVILAIALARALPKAKDVWVECGQFLRSLAGTLRTATLAAVFVSLIGAAGLRATINEVPATEAAEKNFERWYRAQKRDLGAEFNLNGGLRVVAFTDYQCAYCAVGMPTAIQLMDDVRRSVGVPVELVVRDFPLDPSCNSAVPHGKHAFACEAAAAVRLVRRELGEQASANVGTAFYRMGSVLSSDRIRSELAKLELADRFMAEKNSLLHLVSADAQVARRMGVTSTPTFVVGGIPIFGGGAHLKLAVRYELERQGLLGDHGSRPALLPAPR